jgi:hypothetical protein
MNPSCTAIQERMVAGESLGEADQAHVLACAGCSRLAADCLALDAIVADELDGTVTVPDGFADHVMRRLEAGSGRVGGWDDLLTRRWVQVVLANVGIAFAIVNLLRFVFSTLIPAASLGGVP